jgi:nitroreductase
MIPEMLEKILDLARWAPSGDNTQPWRFEIVDERHFVVHGHDTRDWCVYDLDGRASQVAIGALMENIAIAATDLALRAEFVVRSDQLETHPVIDVHLHEDASLVRDPLVDEITERVTQRRALSTTKLTDVQKRALSESVGSDYTISWIEGTAKRWQMARLLARAGRLRLTIPEAYEVHRRIIEWDADSSEDRIPDRAVGLPPPGLRLMRWAMRSWGRVDFLNRFLAGTWMPRMQLDLIPGFYCGGHFLIEAKQTPKSLEDFWSGGRSMQRFWLTASALGLQFQPEMTPLIFARFSGVGLRFSEKTGAQSEAAYISRELTELFGPGCVTHGIFMGRVGAGPNPQARSIRKPLKSLIEGC